jgi:hypothetical protein
MRDASPEALLMAKAYLHDIEFASQLCAEIASDEGSNFALCEQIADARRMLNLIVNDNVLLKSKHHLLVDRQPAWPRHEALLRFDLPLHRLTLHFKFTKKWIVRFFSMRGRYLYYSDGKNGYPSTREGTLAFVQSKPAPDGRYCIDLQGMDALQHATIFL